MTGLDALEYLPMNNATADALDAVLAQAIEAKASDIHFESQADGLHVRLRVDGLLRAITPPPGGLKDAVLTRLKVLAHMDIAEKRLPQDGRFQHRQPDRCVDIRVSSLPTAHGEKLVARLLHYAQERPNLSSLGYSPKDQAHLMTALQQPHGLILMTGPTGSGKTLSLYSCLDELNTEQRNVSTVEDPVEIHLQGVNQVQINERAGLTFASALRALLRQDPDVLMVGEIRDKETAEIAIQAAQTGHLVLSTLHTNDAPSTLTRLRHMGIAGFNLAASVRLITAQRLVRRLCSHCKTALTGDEQTAWIQSLSPSERCILENDLNTPTTLYRARGCHQCHHGYSGRIGLYQVMPIGPALQTLILQDADTQSVAHQAMQEDVSTLRQAGWQQVVQGITSIEEVLALTTHA